MQLAAWERSRFRQVASAMTKSIAGVEVRSTRGNPMEFSRAICCHCQDRGRSRHLVKRVGVVVRRNDVVYKAAQAVVKSGVQEGSGMSTWVAFHFASENRLHLDYRSRFVVRAYKMGRESGLLEYLEPFGNYTIANLRSHVSSFYRSPLLMPRLIRVPR